MSLHLVGYETSGSEAALTALTPIPDGTVRVSGNDIFVPAGLNNISWATAMINSAAATLRAQIQSPSLRSTLNIDISPINNGLVHGSPAGIIRPWYAPFPLIATEPLDVFVQNGAAVMNRAFISFTDGPAKPVTGNMYTIRGTLAASLATATWVNSTITFNQTLPAGNYNVVGMRCWSANSCAARLFFVGGPWRPGVPTATTEAGLEWAEFRFGNLGIWGTFNNITPPSVDVMGITDTAQTVFLDLIKTS